MLNLFNMADYGLWELVIVNSMIFIIFAFSFFRPRTARDWRTFGAFSFRHLSWPFLQKCMVFHLPSTCCPAGWPAVSPR
jgi:hypothetical protein